MADLPSSSLRLHHPAFYSTGVDCFGPYLIKIGRRTEKRWGIIFKCLTTHGVYLDLLTSMDTDAFLMALRRFIARRGKPHELLSDQGTNFRGGSLELKEAFNALTQAVQAHLASQQIQFRFNPPNAPNFGGSWEREIRSIKSALHTILGSQTITEDMLMTVLIETRSKWQQERDDLVIGSIVMIIDPQLPWALWLVGSVSAVIPGADGRIRTAQIQLAGGVILGIALWLRHDAQTSNLLMTQFEGTQAPGTFYISVYVLIAVGAVMMFVGFLGCYGAIQESQCLLGTFFTCLVILFACEVAAGIWGFINRETISTELISFYDAAYIKAVDPVDSATKQAASKVLGVFHDTLECCGKGDDNPLFQRVQPSLCPKILPDPLISQVFEMIFTMVLCCAVHLTLGKRLSARYSPKNVLGKRKFRSPSFRRYSEEYRLGTGPSNSDSITVSDSSDADTPPRKKKATGTSSEDQKMASVCDNSSTEAASPENSTPSKKNIASTSESSLENPVREGDLAEPSCSGMERPQPKPASAPGTPSSQPAKSSSSSPGEKPSNLPAPNDTSLQSDEERASSENSVLCHYCSSREQRPAVKTCLVCGASMCPEHLRVHLDSPVFQNHPLVPAVEDVSPWRCQEHQEMNRIYCRPCGVCVCTVCTVIGLHKDHDCISIREAEKELREVVEGTRAAVIQQYQALREALEMEEQQALHCVSQEESRVLGSIEEQLGTLNHGLNTIQSTFNSLQRLADAHGAARAQDQAFIMEYSKIAECINNLSDPLENLESVEEINQGRLNCLQDWTERRLEAVIISMPHRDPFRLLYGLSPTLDPDTAHPKLLLSAENRQVDYSEIQQTYPESDARFSVFPQVLGSKALHQGRHYWEVDVSLDEGRWKVGVSDGQIARKGQKDSCRIGFYPNSWCLMCEKGKVEALHDKTASSVCATGLQKVGILLDFEEGCLSFYSVAEEGILTLLYSFQHTFSEPLYPALAVSKSQLSICDLFARPATE
ncbi:hypothetical protein NFI96_002487 [Prochilodus magdalenae]|nr:hypothetical protein NFI96_002487 [Prochilodus magdalenae]